jgi:hypothetical protein
MVFRFGLAICSTIGAAISSPQKPCYGCLFALDGIDEEDLTNQELEADALC